MFQHLATDAKGQSSFPAPYSKAKTDGEIPSIQATEEEALQTKGAESRADIDNVTTRHVMIGTLPCVKITSLRHDAYVAMNAVKFSKGTWYLNRNLEKKRVHREELFKSVNLTSVVFARLSLRRGHKRKPCAKKDAPAEQHGIWRKILQARECRESNV